MLEQFLSFINGKELCKPSDSILLAVSGGKDSMAMLELFFEASFKNISVAHCNFQLRGAESDADAELVKDYCEAKSIPFFSKPFDTVSFANSEGISIEMAARNLRYAWFKELMELHKIKYLATAHHLHDNLETIIMGLAKGIGPKGLRGIPINSNNIIRPLLFATPEQIIAYLIEKNIAWREDASNATTDYQRNKVRHNITPVLKEINPGLEQTFAKNLSRFEALSEIFEQAFSSFKEKYIVQEQDVFIINTEHFKNVIGLELLFEEFLKPFGFNYAQVQNVLELSFTGKSIFSHSHKISYDRGSLILEKLGRSQTYIEINEPQEIVLENGSLMIETIQNGSIDFKNSNIAYFDAQSIKWPLIIRNCKTGDKFQPFGMKGQKLVSDFLTDLKLPTYLRQSQLLLSDVNNIMWLVGLRTDDRYKVSQHSSLVLKVTFSKP